MTKYEQLTADLKEAVFKATLTAAITEDGGTCNFDSLMLDLPRWQHSKVDAAVKLAGLSCWYSSTWKEFIISVPVCAQGDCRTAQAEAMRDVMRELGYSAGVYYQMD